MNFDKANIVNKEMNKNKLQTYVDTQKRNIDIVMQRLEKDKNSIQTNINIPIDVLNKILDMIKNLNIPQTEKNKLLSELFSTDTVSTCLLFLFLSITILLNNGPIIYYLVILFIHNHYLSINTN